MIQSVNAHKYERTIDLQYALNGSCLIRDGRVTNHLDRTVDFVPSCRSATFTLFGHPDKRNNSTLSRHVLKSSVLNKIPLRIYCICVNSAEPGSVSLPFVMNRDV